MTTGFLITTKHFSALSSEEGTRGQNHGNSVLSTTQLGSFIGDKLAEHGYRTRLQCQEDWGDYLELEHAGTGTLIVGCANTGHVNGEYAEHRVFVVPQQPSMGKFFRKNNVEKDVEHLTSTLQGIFQEADGFYPSGLLENGKRESARISVMFAA